MKHLTPVLMLAAFGCKPPVLQFTAEQVGRDYICGGSADWAECYVAYEPRLSGATIFASKFRVEEYSTSPPAQSTVVLSADLPGDVYLCDYMDTINGTLHCAEGESGEPSFRVFPVGQEDAAVELDGGPVFFGCDPDGDGIQSLCTGSGYDDPPFDGVLDGTWSSPQTLEQPFDRPGGIPLMGDLAASPDAWELLSGFSRASESSIDGVMWRAYRSSTGVTRMVNETLPMLPIDIEHPSDARKLVYGRFHDAQEGAPWVFTGAEEDAIFHGEGALYDEDGHLVGTVMVEEPPDRLRVSGLLGPDLDGDGINEIVYYDAADLRIWKLRLDTP